MSEEIRKAASSAWKVSPDDGRRGDAALPVIVATSVPLEAGLVESDRSHEEGA